MYVCGGGGKSMYVYAYSLSMCIWCFYLSIYQSIIGLMGRVFTNDLEDQGSFLGRVIPKNQKMVLDATLC